MSDVVVEPFGEQHLEGFAKLFEGAASPCFCRYWHFTGTKNEWLDRCAHRPEENLAEQTAALREGSPTASGLVAIATDGAGSRTLVGWMKLSPREAVPKLTSLAVYKSLAFEPGTWTIGCFLIAPGHRRQGVATALVAAAESLVSAWGGRFLEAHPRHAEAPLYDEEAWQGPERLFVERGYSAIHAMAPYPVYRKVIDARKT